MLTQLNPPLPVEVIERGPGQAIAVIDYGPEHRLIWVTALNAGGEIWCASNPRVRVQSNWTFGRTGYDAGKASSRVEPCTCAGEKLAEIPPC